MQIWHKSIQQSAAEVHFKPPRSFALHATAQMLRGSSLPDAQVYHYSKAFSNKNKYMIPSVIDTISVYLHYFITRKVLDLL